MKLKKLPIGISTLKTILDEGYLYVDKTDIAQELIENGQYYFLSRPRRFGKSLFLDTLKTIFDGNKAVFKGLSIDENGYTFEKHPIIHISFGSGDFSDREKLNQTIYEILDTNERHLGIECPKDFSSAGCFKRLIEEAYIKYNKKVVVLVDEYDKPILDNIDQTEIARENRELLKNFYSVIKNSDEYIKFVFITGVSKFSKVSLFSGLNNIQDITLHYKYATICGYTQNDIETTFARHLEGQDFEKIKTWYNGYKFLGEGVYNPFDILLFISNNFEFRNYWFSTATPSFLLKIIEKNNYFLPNLENIIKDETMLNSFDVDYIELETLMWQTGYLTIVDTKETPKGIRYQLDIPNQEVKISLMGSIADFMSKIQNSVQVNDNILYALLEEDLVKLEVNIKALFASIPYNLFTNNKMYEYEGYYVSLFYAYIKALGFDIVGEDVTNKGRIDLTIKLDNAIYICEFKTDGTSALEQIKEKQYHEKYLAENLPIYLLGITFDTQARNISTFECERLQC
ncbi:ATP-binding protein [sulfur-oxidizing endosymbiont of Gigantopelta aegis]|uniref:ATP-binding protein n=1 Tax=sulfur-oxidizing endosymbiont of Gigantopelta aegis TaxID=2794934 RepID=UPI0018DC43E0|nr:ATP-binding protein [sulfur-oxidizing endosymbiont of Gigantopelta aegis]